MKMSLGYPGKRELFGEKEKPTAKAVALQTAMRSRKGEF